MRAFVAVGVPAPQLDGLRPSPVEAPSHLTLLFLGEVPDDAMPGLADAFRDAVAPEPPFRLSLRGLGTFPTDGRPRILFAKVHEGASALATLHARLRAAAGEARLRVDDRPFAAHLTLLRVRGPRDVDRVHHLRAQFGEAEFGSVVVTEVELKSSVLAPSGASHRVEARLPLNGRPERVSPVAPDR